MSAPDLIVAADAVDRGDRTAPPLEVVDLYVKFHTRQGVAHAVNGVSLTVGEGETLAVLGESGCGKSVTAHAVMGIVDSPPGFVVGGQVRYRSVCVMYAGRVVEQAPVVDIYRSPAHPYTKALLESIPRVDLKGQQLQAIQGMPPALTSIPPGCAFAPRCGYAQPICRIDPAPRLEPVAPGRVSACHFAEEVMRDG